MKKINILLSLLFVLVFCNLSFGQTQPPNGSFEDWTSTTQPTGWTTSVNVIMQIDFATQVNDFHDGTSAVQIQSQDVFGNAVPGICTYGNINVNMGAMSAEIIGGKAFTDRPSKFSGWFKYTPSGSDSMVVFCVLTKFNSVSGVHDTVGSAMYISTVANATYQQFNVDFDYQQSFAPDTMNILILSSGYTATAGSSLIVDELKFDYTGMGIDDNFSNNFYIYPNPSNGIFNVNLANKETTHFTVYNSLGQVIYQTTTNNIVNTIDLSSYNKGLYLLEINNGKSIQSRKLIVK